MKAHPLDAAIARLAAHQHGAIARAQIIDDLEGSVSSVQRRVACGLLGPSGTKGVYHVAGSDDTWERRLWTVYLAAGHRRYVSRDAAGAIHGLESFGKGDLSVTVPHGQHQLCYPGAIHQTRRPWPEEQLVVVGGLLVTDVAATIVDIAGSVRARRLFEVVDGAIHDRKTSVARVARAHRFADYPNRAGRLRLLAVMDRLGPGEGFVQSKLERIFHETVAALGFEPWTPQFPHPALDLPTSRADAGDRLAQMIAEMDSRTWHSRNRDRRRDTHRDRAAGLVGYHVERITGEELLANPELAVQEIEAIRQLRRTQLQRSA